MKVLGIVGSPRKEGNTEIMMEAALAAARESGAETEIFLLHDKNIKGCDACGSCFQTGKCHIKDDMQVLYVKMEAADAILFGTPVYFHNYSAQAKAVIDRTFCFLRDHKLMGKVGAPIIAVRRIGAGQTRIQIYGWFLAQKMVPVGGAVAYAREKGDALNADGANIGMTALEEARGTGRDVVETLKRLS
jgi:multimeric flavodoxin WrbA